MTRITGAPDIDSAILQWLAARGEVLADKKSCHGGSINKACLLETVDGRHLFLKWSMDPRTQGAFAKEALALERLAEPGVISVPLPLCRGDHYLLTTAFDEAAPAWDWQETIGRQLALLHRDTPGQSFGFDVDNLLGFSHQPNTWHEHWVAFWRDQRLLPQVQKLEQVSGRAVKQRMPRYGRCSRTMTGALPYTGCTTN